MIKGKVIEVTKRYSIIASEDGCFYKLKNFGNMTIGQSVFVTEEDLYMESKVQRTFSFKQMAVVAAMLIFMSSFSTVYFMDQFSAYASVVVDVNPSIELLINKHDNVIKANALNDDGLNLNLSNLKGKKIEDAIELLVNEVGSQGYLKGEEAYVLITTVPLKEMSETTKQALKDKIIGKVNSSAILQKTNVAVTQITKEQLDQSKEDGVPAGLVTFEVADDNVKSVTVQEFFKAEDNKEAFSAVGSLVQGSQADAVASATQNTSESKDASGSDDSASDLREDLMERIIKLRQVPSPSDAIKDLLARADQYFKDGKGDLAALTGEAKKLWEGVKDSVDIEDSSEGTSDSDDDSNSSDSVNDLRDDLAERLTKLKSVSSPSAEVKALIAQAEAYFATGAGNLNTLEAEARRLWEQVKDQPDSSDDSTEDSDEDSDSDDDSSEDSGSDDDSDDDSKDDDSSDN